MCSHLVTHIASTGVRAGLLHAAPAYLSPSDPAYLSPSDPAYLSPSDPAYLSPSDPAYLSPSDPAYLSPSDPAYLSPSDPAYLSPSDPAYLSPSDPAYLSPPDPALSRTQSPLEYKQEYGTSSKETRKYKFASLSDLALVPLDRGLDPVEAGVERVDRQEFVSLLSGLLRLGPASRLTPDQALLRPFITQHHLAVHTNVPM